MRGNARACCSANNNMRQGFALMALALRSLHSLIFLGLVLLTSMVNGSAIAQPHLSSDGYQFNIHPENPETCSPEASGLAFEIREGAVRLAYRRGPLATAKISPDGSVLKLTLGSEGCRFSIVLARMDTSYDIHALVARNVDGWGDAPSVVRLAEAVEGCVHVSYAASLSLNMLTTQVSYDSNELEASPNSVRGGIGQGRCLIRASSSRFN